MSIIGRDTTMHGCCRRERRRDNHDIAYTDRKCALTGHTIPRSSTVTTAQALQWISLPGSAGDSGRSGTG